MYKRIAIAIDNSDCSPFALDQALKLVASEEGEAILVTVIPGYQGDLRIMGNVSVLDEMRKPYINALENAAAKAATCGIRHKKIVRTGDPAEILLATLEEEQADLVVIGKKASRLSQLIPIGSMAAKLLKLSSIDVLIVPCGKTLDLGTILLAYDGSPHAEKAAEAACSLALRYGSAILLTTLYEMSLEGYALSPELNTQLYSKASKNQEPIIAMLKERGVRKYTNIVEHGDTIYWALSEIAQKKEIGLAVLGSRGAGNISKILLGSVAARFISTGVCPTLVVKG